LFVVPLLAAWLLPVTGHLLSPLMVFSLLGCLMLFKHLEVSPLKIRERNPLQCGCVHNIQNGIRLLLLSTEMVDFFKSWFIRWPGQ
jgi:hypothetical protein